MFERHGLSVIPVPAPSKYHDGKKPSMAWREYQTRLPTKAEMRWWFGRAFTNYAVITGKISGIVVVDVDDKAALPWLRWNLPATPWIVKTSKGWHCYYRFPRRFEVGNRARVAGMKIDVRGEGGYVIGPGSIHGTGFLYRAVGDWSARYDSVPELNPEILQEPAQEPRREAIERPKGPVIDRARAYLKAIPRPTLGAGSDQATFQAACRLVRGFSLLPPEAVAVLAEWAPDFNEWWLRRKVMTAVAYGKEPMGSLL